MFFLKKDLFLFLCVSVNSNMGVGTHKDQKMPQS